MATKTFTLGPFPGYKQNVDPNADYRANYNVKLVLEQTTNETGNNSSIKWQFYIWWTVTTGTTSGWQRYNNNAIKVIIDGTTVLDTPNIGTVDLKTVQTSAANPLLLAEGSTTVYHESNGEKELSVSARYTPSSNNVFDYIEAAGTVDLLSTKSSASISDCPDLTLDGSNDHAVTWNSISGMYYKVEYKYGDEVLHTSDVVAGTGSAVSATWEDVPVSIASYAAASASSMSVSVALSTYSDAACTTLIGTDTRTFTVTFAESAMIPVIGSITLTHSNQLDGSYVAGKSSTGAAWEVETRGGASVASSYAVYVDEDGNELSNRITGSGSASLGILTNFSVTSKNIRVKVSVTDSRGNSAETFSAAFTAYGYAAPSISVLSLERCDASGNRNPAGEYFKAYVSYSIRSLNAKNGKHMGLSYFFTGSREDTSTWISPEVADPAGYNGTVALGPYPLPTGSEDSITVIAYVWDYYTAESKASKEAAIRSSNVFVDILTDNHGKKLGLAFFKVNDKAGTVQLGCDLEVDGTINFYDANSVARCTIDPTAGIIFRDANGAVTKTYSNT